MEIGSFLELQFDTDREWHKDGNYERLQVARLNSGRAAIYHAFKCLNAKTIYLPYYQCDTVREFLSKKGVQIKYYSIDEDFAPMLDSVKTDESSAILIVNYYGIFSFERMSQLVNCYKNVIIDNSQAFFANPIDSCMNVYSARKFVGVPDGAYVIGENALENYDSYRQGYSSDTAGFLLQRHEYGCEGKVYQSRMINEHRIDNEDIMKMSVLTRKILDGTDYQFIIEKRKNNFEYACKLFNSINLIDVKKFYGNDIVPMVYPLVIEDERALNRLLEAKHFQGHWWSYLTSEMSENTFEHWLSKFMIPITIDQRYGKKELDFLKEIISK